VSRARPLPVLLLLAGLLPVGMILSLGMGAAEIPPMEVLRVLLSKLGFAMAPDPGYEGVIWHLRVPRVLLAALTGAVLSVTGALMQGLFRNPLADPGLIGISSGAALGAVFILVLGTAIFPNMGWLADQRLLPVAAFLGALGVTIFIYQLAQTSGFTAVATLLLAGVAVNALVGSILGLSSFLATDAQIRSLTFWTLGSLGAADWKTIGLVLPFSLVLLLIAPRFAAGLNALSLGEAEAGHLGFAVEAFKRKMIFLVAAGVGICVAFTGIIGFIGLVVPHMIRLWIGPDHRSLLPASALLGALLLTLADTCARTIVAPAELPVGILTAAFGAPFFLYLLLRQRSRMLRF